MSHEPDRICSAMSDVELIGQALARGAREALLRHKRAGNPICVERDGEIIWIPPDEIEIPAVESEWGPGKRETREA